MTHTHIFTCIFLCLYYENVLNFIFNIRYKNQIIRDKFRQWAIDISLGINISTSTLHPKLTVNYLDIYLFNNNINNIL